MAQFAVYKNRNPATRSRFPLLLDVQSNLLESLATRVVVPLSPVSAARDLAIKQLVPVLLVDNKQYAMLTPQLAGISRRELSEPIADLTAERVQIIAALDLLLTGI